MLMPVRRLPERLCPLLAGLLIVGAAAAHLAFLAWGGGLDLAPDEAHYWDWSRHLDWSYYSKGPLVAWLIRASCTLLGGLSERLTGSLTFAVRVPAVLCGSLLVASLYALTREVLGSPRLALAVVAAALTMPVVAVGSTLMTIDSPYTCCWGWALVFAHRAVTGRSKAAWDVTGLLVGVGILAKYNMVVFLPSLGLFLLFRPERRRLLLSAGFWRMAGWSAACCLPIALWNAQNGWVTLLHVARLAGIGGGGPALRGGRGIYPLGPLNYLGTQAGLLLGYWFICWLGAMVAANPLRDRDAGRNYLWWMSAPMFLLFLAFSPKTNGGEPNWPVTAYLSGTALGAWWLHRLSLSPRPFFRLGVPAGAAATGLAGLALAIFMHHTEWLHPLMERAAGGPTPRQPFPARRFDPTCRLRGWRHLAGEIDAVRARLQQEGADPVLAGVSWSLPGELGVYCTGHPPAYSLGLAQGDRHSQYDFWDNPIGDPERFRGRSFVIVGPVAAATLAAFERVEPPFVVTYARGGRPLAAWMVTVAHGFKAFPAVRDAGH